MTARRALNRQPVLQRATAQDRIVLLGTILVLALVALLPLALALVPADDGAAGDADAAGIGSGAGELSAAALSALHRDLNNKRSGGTDLPAPAKRALPLSFAACSCKNEGAYAAQLSCHDPSTEHHLLIALLAPDCSGPGPDGIPLLL